MSKQEQVEKLTRYMADFVSYIGKKLPDDVIAKLAEDGYDANYGARPLRRAIQRSVEDALSEEIIAGKIALGNRVKLYVNDEKRICFEKLEVSKAEDALTTTEPVQTI